MSDLNGVGVEQTDVKNETAPKLSFKPSLMIASQITLSGGVVYDKGPTDTVEGDNTLSKTWTTTRTIPNLSERRKAEAVASECRRLILAVCYRSAFGYLCAVDREPELDQAIATIKSTIVEANKTFQTCRLSYGFMKAVITSNDQEAANQLATQLGGMVQKLAEAVDKCDAKTIKQTLAQFKGIDSMLPDAQSKTLKAAMDAAKKAAAMIVKQVEKKGEAIEKVRDEIDFASIDVARVMFVEVDVADADMAPMGVPVVTRPSVDLEEVEIGA